MINAEIMAEMRILDGNCVAQDTVHNGGWYDLRGVKIGWGDLSPTNLVALCEKIGDDDALLILHESDSFFKFVESYGVNGATCVVDADGEKHPGIDYVMSRLAFVVHDHQLFHTYTRSNDETGEEIELRNGVKATCYSTDQMRKKLKKLIRAAKPD